MLRNPEAEAYFLARGARDEVGTALLESLGKLGEVELRGDLSHYASPYGVTNDIVFCGAAGVLDTFWRLRPSDREIAIASGANECEIGPEWVRISLFRPDWPRPDLAHWALKSYEFARTGR